MLHIKNLHKSYGAFEVLRGLEMNVNTGDIYGFLGKNGCGKTTTNEHSFKYYPQRQRRDKFRKRELQDRLSA